VAALWVTGCRRERIEPFTEHRATAEAVLRNVRDLEARRMAIESASDIAALIAGLKMLQPPQEPEPPHAPAPTDLSSSSSLARGDTAAPSSPEQVAPSEKGPPRLRGILRHPREPLVILGGRTVGVGEGVDGYRVERILDDRVVLIGPDGAPVELRQYEAPIPPP